MYPGNESEKPILRDVIAQLKSQNNITGKTIHVADKGLNCAQNIAFSRKNGDGYLFSKSVKGLPETEKTWVLLDNDFTDVKDKNGTVLYRYKSCIDEFPYKIEQNGKKYTVKLHEKRLLTYTPSLAAKKKYEINRMVESSIYFFLTFDSPIILLYQATFQKSHSTTTFICSKNSNSVFFISCIKKEMPDISI